MPDIDEQEKLVKKSNAFNFINLLPKKLNTLVGEKGSELSGGERQRIAIARSLFSDSDLLIFDEFTNSLDEENEKKIFDLIKKLKKTCIIISHNRNILKDTCEDLIELV